MVNFNYSNEEDEGSERERLAGLWFFLAILITISITVMIYVWAVYSITGDLLCGG
jgi:hypothetical protein